MAVYATYRHIELDNIGCGKKRAMQPPGGDCHDLWGAEFKGSPCHQRVLKPPGGGSSDIFGAPDPVQNSPRRVVRTQLQSSSVFGQSETPVRNKPGNDSHNRLFGPVESRPASATKSHLKSNIIHSNEEPSISPVESKSSDTNSSVNSEVDSKATPRRNPVTGDGMYSRDSYIRRSARKRDGNPVTGEGYTATNGEKEPAAPANNPAPVTNGTAHSAPAQRTRVPPGGFSSGLW